MLLASAPIAAFCARWFASGRGPTDAPARLPRLTPSSKASNRIEITTSDLDAFTMNLLGNPKYAKGIGAEPGRLNGNPGLF